MLISELEDLFKSDKADYIQKCIELEAYFYLPSGANGLCKPEFKIDLIFGSFQKDTPFARVSGKLNQICVPKAYITNAYLHFHELFQSGCFADRLFGENDMPNDFLKLTMSYSALTFEHVSCHMARTFVWNGIFHEAAHLVLGHCHYITSLQVGDPTLEKAKESGELTSLDRRTMEFDADAKAMRWTVRFIDTNKWFIGFEKRLRALSGYSFFAVLETVRLYWALRALVGGLLPYRDIETKKMDVHQKSADSLHVSFVDRARAVGGWFHEMGGEFGYGNAYEGVILYGCMDAEAVYASFKKQEINIAKMSEVMRPEYTKWIEECRSNWRRVRTKLLPFINCDEMGIAPDYDK